MMQRVRGERKETGVTPRFLAPAAEKEMPSTEMEKLVVEVIFRGNIRSWV